MNEPAKYRRIAADLQVKIQSGEFTAGQKLPSDAKLATGYQASRRVIAEAIKLLLSHGLVGEQPGRRVLVLPKILPFSTVVTTGTGFGGFDGAAYASEVTSRNRKPAVATTRVAIGQAPPDVAALLQLSEGASVVIRHEERFIDDVLWSIRATAYPMQFVRDGATRLLEVEDIAEGARSYLESALGIREIGSLDTMMVRAPSTSEATAFKIPDDAAIPVFEMRQTGIDDATRKPVRLTISIYPADRNQFSMQTGALADNSALAANTQPRERSARSVDQVERRRDDALGVQAVIPVHVAEVS